MLNSCSDAWSSVAGFDHFQQSSYRNNFILSSICLCCHCLCTFKMQHCNTFAFALQANTRKLFSFMLWSFWKRILPIISWLKIKLGLPQSVATEFSSLYHASQNAFTERNYAKSSIHSLAFSFVHLIMYLSLVFTKCCLITQALQSRFPSPVFFTKVLPF